MTRTLSLSRKNKETQVIYKKRQHKSFDTENDSTKDFKGKKTFKNNNTFKTKKVSAKPYSCLQPLDKRITFEKFLERKSVQDAMKVLSLLSARFDFYNPKPLTKGIDKIVRERLKQIIPISHAQVRIALQEYTTNPRYLKAYRVGNHRYDIDDNPTEDVITQEDVNIINERTKICRIKLRQKAQPKPKSKNTSKWR